MVDNADILDSLHPSVFGTEYPTLEVKKDQQQEKEKCEVERKEEEEEGDNNDARHVDKALRVPAVDAADSACKEPSTDTATTAATATTASDPASSSDDDSGVGVIDREGGNSDSVFSGDHLQGNEGGLALVLEGEMLVTSNMNSCAWIENWFREKWG